jgi:hypothetical protein
VGHFRWRNPDTTLWRPRGTVTLNGGQAHLASGANIIGTTPYTYGIVEMSVQLLRTTTTAWWGWEGRYGHRAQLHGL